MLDRNGIRTDLRNGNHVFIRLSRRLPLAGHSGVVSAIELNDSYGKYLVQFEDSLQFRYDRQDLELLVAPCSSPERVVRALLRFARSLRGRVAVIWACGKAFYQRQTRHM